MEPGMGNPEPAMAASEPVIELGGQKKSKAPVIIAVFCAILAVAGVGFGVFGMTQGAKKEDTKEEVSAEPEEEKKDEDYIIYRGLVEKYVSWDLVDGDLVLKALNGDIYDPNYVAYVATEAAITAGIWRDNISTRELTRGSMKYFNREIEMPSELKIRCVVFNNDGHGSYVSTSAGCGGPTNSEPVFEIANVEEKEDTLKITIVYGTMSYGTIVPGGSLSNADGMVYEYPKECDDTMEVCEIDVEGKINDLENYFYEHLDEFDQYTLTFKKEDRRYYLTSSTKVE